MIYVHDHFQPWKGEDRHCLSSLVEDDWIYPADAVAMLAATNAETPMPHREFLSWHAQHGSLATVAHEIHEQNGADYVLYPRVPLVEEWAQPDWQSPHATLWLNATMHATRTDSCGELVRRTYLEIVFERLTVQQLSQAYAQQDLQPASEVSCPERFPRMPISQAAMVSAILSSGFTDRDEAWRSKFKGEMAAHRWDNASFRVAWKIARGGRRGRPKKIRAISARNSPMQN